MEEMSQVKCLNVTSNAARL